MLGNAADVSGNISDSLSNKVSDAINLRKIEISSQMFNYRDDASDEEYDHQPEFTEEEE